MSTEAKRQRILVVDDAPENIRVLGETLRCHYKVRFASNGPEAIAMAQSDNPPDLILLDIMMPEMDGYEVCRRLKADKGTQDIPLIFVTAKSEEESETEGLELGAVDYITKPFSPARVLARVRVHLEQKLAKEALRESEERVRAIFRASPDPAVVYDGQGHPRFMNPAFTRVFGWSLDELRGRNIPFVPEDQKEATAATIRALYESGEPLTLETQRLTKEGNTLDILISAAVIQEHQGQPTGLVVNLTDITHTKKLQDQLQRAQKMEAIGTLAGGIAHDFNNLLSVILGNISMAKEDLTPEHGTYPLLSDAEEASIRTKELTHQLITFSRGGAPIRKRGAITGLLKGATTLALAGSNVSYDFSLAENLWPVEHDETQMKHVITNLITNACEAMPEGGTIKVTAENFTASGEQEKADIPVSHAKYVRISIQDHGCGIPEKDLSTIFDPYFSTKERGEKRGMGLGLATAYSIIDKHDGGITVESQPGVGATFHIYLPAASAEGEEQRVEAKDRKKGGRSRGRLLVMDDEEMLRELAGKMLKRLGYDVALTKNGTEAIEVYQKAMDAGEPFDAVILDLTVRGGMGGKEAVRKLKEMDPQAKAIVSSGYFANPVMKDWRQHGFDGAMEKPYQKGDLMKVLEKTLRPATS